MQWIGPQWRPGSLKRVQKDKPVLIEIRVRWQILFYRPPPKRESGVLVGQGKFAFPGHFKRFERPAENEDRILLKPAFYRMFYRLRQRRNARRQRRNHLTRLYRELLCLLVSLFL